MTHSDEGPADDWRPETIESKLNRWEGVVIKGFAILFLILFLSEKAAKEMGHLASLWGSQISSSQEACGAAPANSLQR
jgi:hypothetical protein